VITSVGVYVQAEFNGDLSFEEPKKAHGDSNTKKKVPPEAKIEIN